MALDALVLAGPWAIAAFVGLPVAGKVLVAGIALRGAESKDRAAIIKATSDLFRWWRR